MKTVLILLLILAGCAHDAPIDAGYCEPSDDWRASDGPKLNVGRANLVWTPLHYIGPAVSAVHLLYGKCTTEYDMNLTGANLGEYLDPYADDEFVYSHKLEDNKLHHVSCKVDWKCDNPVELPYEMGQGCYDQSRCCDLGVVK